MVKSNTKKMHLEINNDLELDINNASISKKNKNPKKKSSPAPIKRKITKTPKRMLSVKPKMLAKEKRPTKRMTPSILVNGKRTPVKVMKMSSRKNASGSGSGRGTPNSKRVASTSKRAAYSSRRKVSNSRRKVPDSRRKVSDSRRKASATRRKVPDARRKASDTSWHSMKSKGLKMSSDTKREATLPLASSSKGKAPKAKVASQNQRFSLKINALKLSSGGKKKVRSIRKKGFSQNMVRARDSKGRFAKAKEGTKGASNQFNKPLMVRLLKQLWPTMWHTRLMSQISKLMKTYSVRYMFS